MKSLKHFLILLPISLIIFLWGRNEFLVEKIYAQTVFPSIAFVQRFVSSIFPFAIGDLIYIILVLGWIWKFISLIKVKKGFRVYGLFCLNSLLFIYIIFKILWGLNYNRPQLYQTLQIDSKKYDEKTLLQLANLFLFRMDSLDKKLNTKQLEFNNNHEYLFQESIKAYQNASTFNTSFQYRNPSIKPALSSWLTSKMGIEGYYNPLSGEANVNMILPSFVLPFVACHEIAHQIGLAEEDKANLIGYLACLQSEDLRFQYSAYFNLFHNILFEIRLKYPQQYPAFRAKISNSILDKFNEEREFWVQYNGNMSKYMSATFDKILKLNNQEKGIDSYQDIVLWLYNYHKHELAKH